MEIIVGSIPPLMPQGSKPKEKEITTIEAQVLHVRQPRKGIAGPSGMERRGKKATDPHKGRVLTLMVPDADLLPADLDSGKYKVFLRVIRK